jgi:hypothetical protein
VRGVFDRLTARYRNAIGQRFLDTELSGGPAVLLE